ncbi:hypothetical protein BDA99DRAFT_494125 [Phascolomyces articulosus]|uniref:Uncharacterized protein n=1 Tax=Phascolomyces articulosus TaxID=60185 RepID=A0AAD5PJF7_9FUNG|nr:hypothetical protein BDA99DRAFT_494125 [Phascolomyces articulosus]
MFRGVSLRLIRQYARPMSTANNNKESILALPATAEETIQVDVNDTYKLKELGPVVVNEDGSLSRINNWHEMADIEKANVNRILLKRNRQRLEKLKKAEQEAK